jgi:hypothetical protein
MTAVALVACSAAGADPGASPGRGITARPGGWKQLPPIATAVAAAAKADGVAVDAVDAWGEPAAGCYAVWLELHGGAGDAAALADQVLAGLQGGGGPRDATAAAPKAAAGSRDAGAGARRGFSITELVKPSGADGVLAFAFASPAYHGRLRAQLGNGRITTILCFANQREPLRCEAACTRVLEAVP